MEHVRRCCSCKRELPESFFYKNATKKSGVSTICKVCQNAARKAWRDTPSGRSAEKKYRDRIPSFRKVNVSPEYARARSRVIKEEVLKHYGNGTLACVRCGFNDIRALSIDHKSENGAQERRDLRAKGNKGGSAFYSLLKKSGFPDGYQTLCYNCNVIKYREYVESNRS